jgi:hypothetical protein
MPTVIAYKGLPFSLVATFSEGIDARYTEGKFQVRDMADETLTVLLSCTQATGLTIDHGAGTVSVSIGATQTETLPVTNRPRTAKGQIRLYNPANDEDTMGGPPFDVVLSPEVIDD